MRCRAPVDALYSAENENDNDDDNDLRWTRLCRHWGGHQVPGTFPRPGGEEKSLGSRLGWTRVIFRTNVQC